MRPEAKGKSCTTDNGPSMSLTVASPVARARDRGDRTQVHRALKLNIRGYQRPESGKYDVNLHATVPFRKPRSVQVLSVKDKSGQPITISAVNSCERRDRKLL